MNGFVSRLFGPDEVVIPASKMELAANKLTACIDGCKNWTHYKTARRMLKNFKTLFSGKADFLQTYQELKFRCQLKRLCLRHKGETY